MPEDYDNDLYLDQEPEDESAGWLTTFADLSMLLLVFFVLLFTMSSVDGGKFSDTFSSVTRALGGKADQLASSTISREEAGVLLDQAMLQKQIVESQRKVFSEIKTLDTTKGLEGIVSANFEDGVITLRLPGDVLFAPGEVSLSPEGQRLVRTLADTFNQYPDQDIKIVGHTDDVPPAPGARFNDNWEISAMRAVNVLRELLDLGIDPGRLTAVGLADYEPLLPNTTEENRGKNRRVEFILEKRVVGGQ